MLTLWNDLRYALRQLRRSPGFAATVVVTLALGVGANAVVFSVLNALVLRPLPMPHAEQLVAFNRMGNTGSSVAASPAQSYPDYRDLRDGNRSFSGLAAYSIQRVGVRVGTDAARESWITEASDNYFDVLGIQPALGRFFHTSDAHGPNSMPYVVLSHSYWERRFAGDPHVIGRVIELDKHPFTVLGVAPPSFSGTELFLASDFWIPMLNEQQTDGYNYLELRGNHNIWVLGRFKPGIHAAQGEADLNTLAKHMAAVNPGADENLHFRLSRPGLLGDLLGGPVRAFLWGVMALAGLVLLAACANLGSIFAVRAADRSRELAVRLALGASRAGIVRQLTTEAVLLSLLGGALGLALAGAALRALTAWRPSPEYPISFQVHADARVSLLALLLAIGSGILFGLIPARQVWRTDAYQTIKSGSGAQGGGRRWTLRDGLLILQVVLCSILVTSSLVAVRGLARGLHADYGFQPHGAMLASFDLHMAGYTDEKALAAQRRAIDMVAALPGVTAVGTTQKIPLNLSTSDTDVWRDGTTDLRDSNAAADATYYNISPNYFAAAGTRLLAGRDFTWHDDAKVPRVAAVNQVFVRKVFGLSVRPADAVGRYFTLGGPHVEVVGVVEDGKYNTITEDPTAAMFVPVMQRPDTSTALVVRSRGGDAATAAAMHAALSKLDPNLPVAISSWPQAMAIMLLPSVAATAALGVMGGLAAMLAVTGIFGMASYAVSKRMREFGLRVALGAGRGDVLKAALGRPAKLLAYGSAAGLVLGAAASKLLAHIVYQATSQDPVVLFGAVLAMTLLALAATWIPARRALHADPAQLLREE